VKEALGCHSRSGSRPEHASQSLAPLLPEWILMWNVRIAPSLTPARVKLEGPRIFGILGVRLLHLFANPKVPLFLDDE